MDLTLVLTQRALRDRDVANILGLHEESTGTRYLVLVPADAEHNVVVEVINHLSLFEIREAWRTLTDSGEEAVDDAKAEAVEALQSSLQLFGDAGANAAGSVVADDPMPAVSEAVRIHAATQLIVVTEPNAVEDALYRDWASRARHELEIPVLHFYSGTDSVG